MIDPSVQITRLREKQRTDRSELDALLDSARIAHIGLVRPDRTPVVIATLFARDGDRILIHGSTGAGWLRLLQAGAAASVAVTAVDAIVVARSAFESSMRYRSAVIFGSFAVVNAAETLAALEVLTEAVLPGRWAEVRAPTAKEIAATVVLQLPITSWSLKVSDGWPDDPVSDVEGPAWAGIVPVSEVRGTPQAAPDLRPGIPIPPSLLAPRL
jgi:nitroimidazol reductase NimA-like FMN-containing flavoprotein (pyridoxamine 5'-phosphate oxidase superfamily)